MTPIGRLVRCPWGSATLRLDREHDLRPGDTLAASHMRDVEDLPLRTGRMVVAAVRKDLGVLLTQPAHDSIPALVADPEHGDWLYRDVPAGSWPTEHESDCCALNGGDCCCPMGNL